MHTPITRRDALTRIGAGSLAGVTIPALASAGHEPARPIRILAYNIHHGAGLDGVLDLERIAGVIRDAEPALVALQEIDRNTGRSGNVDQLQELAEMLQMHHRFGKFMDYDGGEYGLGVLSKFPIIQHRVIELPPGQREPRVALLVRARPPGWSVDAKIVSVHLDWLSDDTERFAQAQALEAALRDEQGVVIPAGDFNDLPKSRTMQFLKSKFDEAEKPDDASFTFRADDPDREIDYVLWRGPQAFIARSEAGVVKELVASDHRPVLAVLTPAPVVERRP